MHVSETDVLRGQKLSDEFREGDSIRVRILRIEVDEQRIGLSMRDVPQPDPSEALPEPVAETAAGEPEGGGEPETSASPDAEVDVPTTEPEAGVSLEVEAEAEAVPAVEEAKSGD